MTRDGLASVVGASGQQGTARKQAVFDAYPTESWWLDTERFYDRARAEAPRMRQSRYGQAEWLSSSEAVETPRRKRGTDGFAS